MIMISLISIFALRSSTLVSINLIIPRSLGSFLDFYFYDSECKTAITLAYVNLVHLCCH